MINIQGEKTCLLNVRLVVGQVGSIRVMKGLVV